MIVASLMNIIKSIIVALVSPFNIGGFPDGSVEQIHDFFGLLFENASTLLNLFLPFKLVVVLVGVVIVSETFMYVYRGAMWVLRKIPFLGIK